MIASEGVADDLVRWLVEEGRKSVAKHETRPEKIRGCLEGFRIVAEEMAPHTPEHYEAVIKERHDHEYRLFRDSDHSDEDVAAYWEYRCATAQIEHVYERLKVLFGAPTISAMAGLQVVDYLKERGVA